MRWYQPRHLPVRRRFHSHMVVKGWFGSLPRCRSPAYPCGSNGYRTRLWKHQLQVAFCNRFSLEIKVCHYPPGSSKWNPIEHRMFSFISSNWTGQPLLDYETVLKFIRATKTAAGLKIRAFLNKKQYLKGIKISDRQMKDIALRRYTLRPNWNYSICPSKM